MSNMISIVQKRPKRGALIFIISHETDWSSLGLEESTVKYLQKYFKQGRQLISVNHFDKGSDQFHIYVQVSKNEKEAYRSLENFRVRGVASQKRVNELNISSATIIDCSTYDASIPFAEGMALANYQFLKYKKEAAKLQHSLQSIRILAKASMTTAVEELNNLVDAVYHARDYTNEPLNYLTAVQFSKEFAVLSKKSGFKLTVFDKKRIQKEKMGGLLAVNLGSPDPPTFSIMEWKPKNAQNKKPYILVGKGVVFDTGGLSLKRTEGGMEFMKCDMGGAATVAGALYAVAKNKLPLYVIGLIPATDNRPGGNAYVPSDVITMHNGLTVEVLNTDAEGRMILADGLSYAKSYDPELVFDVCTLTGSAARAMGPHGAVIMGTASQEEKDALRDSGFSTFERVAEFPFWDEYKDMLKSDIADLKNTGGRAAGAITAGKFLEHFTSYPWIHVDIAPTAWNFKNDAYRLKNGTGFGVRLFYDFLKRKVK